MSASLQTFANDRTKRATIPVQSGLLQRKCACGGVAGVKNDCDDCQNKSLSLQRSALSSESTKTQARSVPPIVYEALRSPGQPLDSETRAFMERRFGHDFSRVRVHTDSKAAESAAVVNALAYTVGRDVAFGAGQYAPLTGAGRKLLAHELAHVVQQGPVASAQTQNFPITVGPSDGSLEREAHRMAESSNRLEPVENFSSRTLQRQEVPPRDPEAPLAGDPAAEAPAAEGACPVTAVTAYGPPDGPPAGNDGMTADTITAMNCLQTAVQEAGGTMSVQTRYRPQAYQDHLVEVWDKVRGPARTEPACAAVQQNYDTERATHFPMGAPARGVSNHTNGRAFDATVRLPADATTTVDALQAGCSLTRPVAGEPWHFER